jgi:hypothetical protein
VRSTRAIPTLLGGDTYCNFPLSLAVQAMEAEHFEQSTRFHTALMKIACDGPDEPDDVCFVCF